MAKVYVTRHGAKNGKDVFFEKGKKLRIERVMGKNMTS